jgi:hypothetical protein
MAPAFYVGSLQTKLQLLASLLWSLTFFMETLMYLQLMDPLALFLIG